mmetsp:Transcript_42174/g.100841  ORF Transcript_42174/g.100841 Transcript_42174/m.100841 type:complete len:782 (+) Transcript_42174:63-2408(+)
MFCLPLVVLLTQELSLVRGLRLRNPGDGDTELFSQQDYDWPHANPNLDETVDDGDRAESSLSDAETDLLDFDQDDMAPSLAELYGKIEFGLTDSETISALDGVSMFLLDDAEDSAYEKDTAPSIPTENGLVNMLRQVPDADSMPTATFAPEANPESDHNDAALRSNESGANAEAVRDSGNATQAKRYDNRTNQSTSNRSLLDVPEYLAVAYEVCSRIKVLQSHMPPMRNQALRQRYAVPQLAYKPYITALPVLYITNGGWHLKKFQVYFKTFSPDMIRIDAWTPSNRSLEHLNKVLRSAGPLLNRVKNWKTVLGGVISHLRAIKWAWERKLNIALILEDDAIPVYPAWQSSLEDFIATLPEDWEAAQLQWTVGLGTNFSQKFGVPDSSASSGPWVSGRAWGTAAYLIHRRGMNRLMSQLWNRAAKRFRLDKLVRHCKMMSADDCLLGFSGLSRNDTIYEQVTWFPNKTEALTQVYLATPSLFAHDCVTDWLQSRNFCQDIAQNTRLLQQQDPPPHTDRLLIFFAANSTNNDSFTILRRNLDYLRNQGFHVFVTYDMFNTDWTTTPTTRKLKMLGIKWFKFGKSWLQDYDYIWAIDEDIPLQSVNFSSAMESAVEADALITGPTLNDHSPSWDAPSRRFQRPHEDCKFRYTNYVEAVAPVFKTKALGWVFQHIGKRLFSPAAMGMDLSWCGFLRHKASLDLDAAVRQGRKPAVQDEGIRPCALMDRVTFTIDNGVDLLDNQTVELKKQALHYFVNQETHFLVRDGIIERGEAFSEHCSETED